MKSTRPSSGSKSPPLFCTRRSKSRRSRRSPSTVLSTGSSWISTPISRRMMSASTWPRRRSSGFRVSTSGRMPSPFGKPAAASSSRAESGWKRCWLFSAIAGSYMEPSAGLTEPNDGSPKPRLPICDVAVAIERAGERCAHLKARLLSSSSSGLLKSCDLHRLAPGVHVDGVEAGPRRHVDDDVGVGLEALDQLGRHRCAADDLDVARLQRRRQRLGLDDRLDRSRARAWAAPDRSSSRTPPAPPAGRGCARRRGTGRCRPASGRTAPRRARRARGG